MRQILLAVAYILILTQICGCSHYLMTSDYGTYPSDATNNCRVQAGIVQQMSESFRDWPYNESFDNCMRQLGYHRVTTSN